MLRSDTNAIIFAILSGAFILFNLGYAEERREGKIPKLNCKECHACESPALEEPCLKACPRLFQARSSKEHGEKEAPNSVLLDQLVNEYGAVHFDHRNHAKMTTMNGGCGTCHHYSPEGHILPCNECHKSGETDGTNLRQPSLKGAYHRQCLSCHREWSHDTECRICHLPIKGANLGEAESDKTDIIGRPHPRITIPGIKVYYTPYEKGPIVTFYHENHIELFGLRCVDCHKQESCSHCHDLQKQATTHKSQEEIHAICSGCHKNSSCGTCHDTVQKPAFTHAATGWPLNVYHQRLECRACHPTGKRISKLSRDCIACHEGWNLATFKHAVTRLQLDEIHSGIDCADCHLNREYEKKAQCGGCHDDNRTPKSNPPGSYLDIKR
ncbi:MAG: hypothetical protein CO189_01390 [candidate division Zixibacteria bacterium CG_4_9_14_3_um_filter_46_8]|nr:MAG: hypothetical protein CO189_01390 [candidate division Zixibacteria bacterium CG_4_9_14_3_um_filter_46_8]